MDRVIKSYSYINDGMKLSEIGIKPEQIIGVKDTDGKTTLWYWEQDTND